MNWLLNKIFGESRYRIQFIYNDATTTVKWVHIMRTTHPKYIANERILKVENGPIWNDKEARPHLKNGTLRIGYINYLGRW